MEEVHEPSVGTLVISRAWYGSTIAEFLATPVDAIFGRLASNPEFPLVVAQKGAWAQQIAILQAQLLGLSGALYLEFNIPRVGRRIDTVLVIDSVVFVIEFKAGSATFERAAIDQVWDYALDLKNFHEASHAASLVPVLVPTDAFDAPSTALEFSDDNVCRPLKVHPDGLRGALEYVLRVKQGVSIDQYYWPRAPYRPTPTIIEAARALYARHSVEAIARFDAGAQNLHITSEKIGSLVDQAKAHRRKIICFVTGVPGAGKTLVGLNVATSRRDADQSTHAVFLSGNGPLVAVLREALTRDEVSRQRGLGKKVRKGQVEESVKAFIQNVHHFRDDAIVDSGPPVEHVVIFDEAQRAWNLKKTADFMRRKKNRAGFSQSEPEFLISCMDRHEDWAVIICLVGGGQEINSGEAGIHAWLEAVNKSFPNWQLYISSNLIDSEYAAGTALRAARLRKEIYFDDALHLAVSMRSFRAENVSAFVKALLDCDVQQARTTLDEVLRRYPIAVTRDLERAKRWIREDARGTERYGLVASSKAQRLKPHAIDVRVAVNPVHWFLSDREDTRSSYYLEDAATEFQVQGLELDWVCVTWDGDLRFGTSGWTFHDYRGSSWQNIRDTSNRAFLRNAYRVLLTRARQGMVIFVPKGEALDHTRSPAYYDRTFNYLCELGVPVIN